MIRNNQMHFQTRIYYYVCMYMSVFNRVRYIIAIAYKVQPVTFIDQVQMRLLFGKIAKS